MQRWEPGYEIPGGNAEPPGLAEEAVFFAAGAPIVEITDAHVVPEVRGKGGIPVLIHGGHVSFVHTRLEAGPDPAATAAAARQALGNGMRIDPDGADVASVLAAGFPSWTRGVLHAVHTR